jgi:exodeoxyribonuclease V beta subunit
VQGARNESDRVPQERVQRLESDAHAVTIETVHMSKGLEYPFVLLPFCWDERPFEPGNGPVRVQGPTATVVNVEAPASARRSAAIAEAREEARREAQRKLYVALTRAKHRTVAWFGPVGERGSDLASTALGRLALRDPAARGLLDEGELVAPTRERAQAERSEEGAATMRTVGARLDDLAARSGGACAWDIAAPPTGEFARREAIVPPPRKPAPTPWPPARPPLASPWRTTSFTGLTRAAHRDLGAVTAAETAEITPGAVDEAHAADRAQIDGRATTALRLTHAGGAVYGTFVHAVLERMDFVADRARDGRPLGDLTVEQARSVGLPSAAAEELAAALPSVVRAPITRPAIDLPDGFCLARVAEADRLDELGFDLRLGAGTAFARGSGRVAAPEALFAAMRGHEQHLPRAWVDGLETRLRDGRLASGLVGVLRGAIDLVFRTRGGTADRYWIVDYKTNLLAGGLDAYVGPRLVEAMLAGDYLLQALLYTVALHRELRVRVAGYDYDTHVGGFAYLFLRGMGLAPEHAGEASPGVYADRFPEQLVAAVDTALEGALPA